MVGWNSTLSLWSNAWGYEFMVNWNTVFSMFCIVCSVGFFVYSSLFVDKLPIRLTSSFLDLKWNQKCCYFDLSHLLCDVQIALCIFKAFQVWVVKFSVEFWWFRLRPLLALFIPVIGNVPGLCGCSWTDWFSFPLANGKFFCVQLGEVLLSYWLVMWSRIYSFHGTYRLAMW